jgi:hypothetical protein
MIYFPAEIGESHPLPSSCSAKADGSSFYVSPYELNAISDINPSQQLSFNPRVERTNSGSFF